MLYFKDRPEAGRGLANKIDPRYAQVNTAVLAVNEGSILVGEEIAKYLHCSLNLLLTEGVFIPGEPIPIGTLDQRGDFLYNSMFPLGYLEYLSDEYHAYIEEQKVKGMSHLNRILGQGGFINESLLYNHVVILVADGLASGASFDAAVEFLKPIKLTRVVAAVPVLSIEAVDKLHVLVDEIYNLGVTENYLETDHYYDANDLPDRQQVLEKIDSISLNWQ